MSELGTRISAIAKKQAEQSITAGREQTLQAFWRVTGGVSPATVASVILDLELQGWTRVSMKNIAARASELTALGRLKVVDTVRQPNGHLATRMIPVNEEEAVPLETRLSRCALEKRLIEVEQELLEVRASLLEAQAELKRLRPVAQWMRSKSRAA